jgi:Tfp pilus assembly protein FimT
MDTRNLAAAVRNALQYTRTSAIRLAYVEEDDDTQEVPAAGEQMPMYRTDLTVRITYTE